MNGAGFCTCNCVGHVRENKRQRDKYVYKYSLTCVGVKLADHASGTEQGAKTKNKLNEKERECHGHKVSVEMDEALTL